MAISLNLTWIIDKDKLEGHFFKDGEEDLKHIPASNRESHRPPPPHESNKPVKKEHQYLEPTGYIDSENVFHHKHRFRTQKLQYN